MLSPSGSRHGIRTAPIHLTGRPAATTSFPSTLLPPRSAALCIWGTFFPIPIQTQWLAFGACVEKVCFTRWAGMTTACQPSVEYRITTACHVMRRLHTSRISTHRFAVTHRRTTERFPFRVRTSLSCAKNSRQKTKRFSKICSVVSAYQSTGRCCTPLLKTVHVAQANERSCATLHVARRTRKKRQHCGTLIFVLQLPKQS